MSNTPENIDSDNSAVENNGNISQNKKVDLGGATVEIQKNSPQPDGTEPDTHVEPIHSGDMPKESLHLHHAESPDELFDCTILGGGPVGLFAAYYAGVREMSVKIIDSLGELGGQVNALYSEKQIYDIGGFPGVKGADLVAGCIEQGLQFGPTICLSERVDHLCPEQDGTYTLVTDKGKHRTKTLIIAAGIGAFAPRKLPPVNGFNSQVLENHVGKQVFYFVKNTETFRDKNLLIVGGGDSAMDWALHLEPVAEKITLIHRRDRWRAHEDTVKKVLSSSVDVRTFYEVSNVQESNDHINRVTIRHNKTEEEDTLDIDAMILCLGFIANIGSIRKWDLSIDKGGIAVNAGTMEAGPPGIYAAGDIARYPGKLNLIATGFAEAAAAANQAKCFIDPDSKLFPGHSSEK